MSGFEIVGLVLAVLPIMVSGIAQYREGADKITGTIRSKYVNEALSEFYDDLDIELFLLNGNLEILIQELPSLSKEYKQQLLLDPRPESWTGEELSEALSDKLGSGNDKIFTSCIRRITKSLEALVADDTNFLSRDQMVSESVFCSKLTIMRNDLLAGTKKTTLYERLRFNTHERKRTKHLEKITRLNATLHNLLARTSHVEVLTSKLNSKVPSSLVRTASHNLHEALACCWVCACPDQHSEKLSDAKLCLKREVDAKDSDELCFSMIFSSMTSWQECLMRISPKGSTPETRAQQIESICALVNEARGCGICLQMLLDDNKKLWRTKPQARSADSQKIVSLETLLKNANRVRVRDRRLLAATLANTFLQLSEGPWIDRRLDKTQVSFLESMQGTIDYERPYVSTSFQLASDSVVDDYNSIHPSPSLLALGILLLEIHLGQPLQITELDMTDGTTMNANSEFTAALRALDQNGYDIYDDYKRAIQACLEPKFINSAQGTFLDNQKIHEAIYENVVMPLEEELYNGYKLKIVGF